MSANSLWPRVIHGSFAPSMSARDAAQAAMLLLRPRQWRDGAAPERLEGTLAEFQPATTVYAVDSGRNAVRLALQALHVGPNDEVLLQAFTCVSVPGPVLWLGAHPVYVDILPETFTMDPEDLRRKISPKSRAVIVQHTFGLPADLTPILAIAKERGLPVIEDCAHALGSTYQGQRVGTFGDAAIFSFGRDKVISSVFGGALILAPHVPLPQTPLPMPPRWWIARQLLHTALAPTIRATYFSGGRFVLHAALKLNVLSKALSNQEKWGGQPPLQPSRLANALAVRALNQFSRLDAFLDQRRALATHYTESLADVPDILLPTTPPGRMHGFLRYAVRVQNRVALHTAARRKGIVLRDSWYDTVVAPRDTDLHAVGYRRGSCPRAEEAARQVVNLPTSPTLSVPDADRVIRVVRATLKQS